MYQFIVSINFCIITVKVIDANETFRNNISIKFFLAEIALYYNNLEALSYK